MVTCDQQEKVLSSQKIFLEEEKNIFIIGLRPNPIEHQAPTGRPDCLLRP